MKPGALLLSYNTMVRSIKKKTLKIRVASPFFGTFNFWMLSVANRIDSALQIEFKISRISLLVIKLLGFLLIPLSIAEPEQKTHLFQ